ncbi:efflux RND transporter periplasmic adaptor subunit [Halanaerobaculum tunisiense]
MRNYKSNLIILTLLIVVTITGCSQGDTSSQNEAQEAESLGIPVATRTLTRQDFNKQLPVTGTLEGTVEINIPVEIAAKVDQLLVEEGTQVKKGTVIARLEDEQLEANLKQAEANLEIAKAEWKKTEAGARPEEIDKVEAQLKQAEANYEQAQTEYKRNQQLYQDGAITEQKFDTVKRNLAVAESNVTIAQENLDLINQGAREEDRKIVKEKYNRAVAQVEAIKEQLADTVITAPRAGVISNLFLEEGELANPNQPLAYLIQQQPLILEADVSSKDLNKLSIGQKVSLAVNSYPQQKFRGESSRIADRVDHQSRTVTLEIAVDNSEQQLKSGMFAEGNLILEEFDNALIIDQDLLRGENNNLVYLVQTEQVEKREVEVEKIDEDHYLVQSGLDAGDEVITSNFSRISTGDRVYVEEQGSEQ